MSGINRFELARHRLGVEKYQAPPGPVRVYVVKWELHPEAPSFDGEHAGVLGVALTDEGARKLAEADAEELEALRPGVYTIAIQGKTRKGEPIDDWDYWLEWDAWEVQP